MSLSILALKKRNGELEEVALELIGKAKRFYNEEVNVILPTDNTDNSKLISDIEQAGANKIYVIKNDKLSKYSTNYYKDALLQAISRINPEILLIGATVKGRDLAPRIASSLGVGLTADCTELSLNEDGKLAATRPTFGGSLMATILSRKNPQMATVRPKVFKKPEKDINNKADITEINIEITDIDNNVEELGFTPKTLATVSIEDADILFAAGKGIKTIENFNIIKDIANALGAKVAASRGLVDMGICSNDIQVGQTGKTVTPKVYIAIGISGAIQHIEGMKGAQTIIAINKDENAPIFKIADYKIVGDLNEILPALLHKVKRF